MMDRGNAQIQRDLARMRETIETLSGERGDSLKSNSAIRRMELRALAGMKMRSKQVTAAPTAADYNALQADVAAIYNALSRISNRLGNADVPVG